jgi:hypothetical protein
MPRILGYAGRIDNVLRRLENGELEGVNPKEIVLLAGTNNVGNREPPEGAEVRAANVTRGQEAVPRLMQLKAPGATIILTSIFPRNVNVQAMPVIDRINAKSCAPRRRWDDSLPRHKPEAC